MGEYGYRRPDKVLVYLYRRSESGDPEYLLLRRAPSTNAGPIWQVVVGTVRWTEDHVETIRREVREETGLTRLRDIAATGYTFSFPLRLPEDQISRYAPEVKDISNTVYAAQVLGDQPVRLSVEHIDYGWFTYDEALRHIHWPEEREALERLHATLAAPTQETKPGDERSALGTGR